MKNLHFGMMVLLCAISALTQAAKPGSEPPPTLQTGFLGVTSSSFIGGAGLNVMYSACQNDYGEGAVVCTTKQYIDSPTVSTQQVGDFWIRPTIVGVSTVAIDYSGAALPLGASSCTGTAATTRGVVLWGPTSYVSTAQCTSDLRALCCR